jgi:hypothetical protein
MWILGCARTRRPQITRIGASIIPIVCEMWRAAGPVMLTPDDQKGYGVQDFSLWNKIWTIILVVAAF